MDFRAVCYLLVTLAAEVLGQNYTNGTNSTDDGCVHSTSSHSSLRCEGEGVLLAEASGCVAGLQLDDDDAMAC